MVVSISVDVNIRAAPFEAAFNMAPRLQLIMARTGEVLAMNHRLRDVLDDDGGAGQGTDDRIEDLFQGSADLLTSDIIAAATGPHLFLRLRDQAGTAPRRISFQVTALRNGTRADAFLLTQVLRDPVARAFREFNDQLQSANEAAAEVRRKTLRLQDRYRNLEQFSHTAAHDLQAPLRNIATTIQFVEEDFGASLPLEARDLLVSAREAADRLQALINDLLAHAKSSSTELDRKLVQLDPMVGIVTRDFSTTLSAVSGRIETAGLLGTVIADPVLLHQLLANLVGNAIKYRHPERPPRIRLDRTQGMDGDQRLVIEDNGLGFTEAQRNRLFEPFQRQHVETGVPGSGIGLTICRTICDRHGWRIEAFGEPGAGARFEIIGIN